MYLDEDYLKLFKQVQEEDKTKVEVKNYDFEFLKQNATNLNETSQLIREVPNYNNFQNYNQTPKQNLNEVNRSNAMGNLKLYVIGCTISLVVLVPVIYFTVHAYSVLGASYIWMFYGVLWFLVWGGIVHNRILPTFHVQWLIKDMAPLVASVSLTSFFASYLININQNESRILIFLLGLTSGIVILLFNAFWLSAFRDSIINKIYKSKIHNG